MNKKLLLVVVVFTVFALAGSAALALAPMGPPTAGLRACQFRAGADYSYSNTDMKVDWGDDDSETIKDFKSNGFWANLGYGVADNWEAYIRFGFANGKISGDDEEEDSGFSGDYGFAYGFGTKVTFLQQENLSWGALFQMGWLNTKDETSTTEEVVEGEIYTLVTEDESEIDVYEIQIAVGPTWKAAEGVSIYGGPFLHFIGGDVDWSETFTVFDEDGVIVPGYTEEDSGSGNVKQKSIFGGYVGAQFDLSENASAFGEFQFTGSAWALGTGVGWKF